MKETAGCLTWLVTLILGLIICPVLSYFCGWLIGDTVVNGMNYLFNTTRFTTDMLPTICGTLGVIGSFFKSTSNSSSKK